MPYTPYADQLIHIARRAGEIIMEYYKQPLDVQHKDDASPVTAADLAANRYIVQELTTLTPHIPIISEENTATDNEAVLGNRLFWLVDPLDGTKSFIKRTGEFTVNIALIEEGKPVGGVVYVPVQDNCYATGVDGKAYKNEHEMIHVRTPPTEGLIVIASHSHRSPETDAYIATLKVASLLSASSSLKFCLVAEGKADVYPRFGRTMEWDTAAGHAVLLAAGGRVDQLDGTALSYGKSSLDNPHFIAKGML